MAAFSFFFYLSKPVIRGLDFLWPHICRLAPPAYKFRYKALCEKRLSDKSKKIFTRQSRFIARIRSTYGLWGIIFATPFILTISSFHSNAGHKIKSLTHPKNWKIFPFIQLLRFTPYSMQTPPLMVWPVPFTRCLMRTPPDQDFYIPHGCKICV